MMHGTPYRYKAFISYSHSEDAAFAPSLQRALETFAKPWYRGRAIRLFRDTTNLSADPDLWASIEHALGESEHFLLLASPMASRSKWVQKELAYWRTHRDLSKLILVLTDGTITWAAADRDFDWSATDAVPRSASGMFSAEPLFIDFRSCKAEKLSTRHPEFLDRIATLAATLHGRDKDEIAGEHVRQHRKTIRTAVAGVIALCVLAIATTIFGVVSRQRGLRIDAQNVSLRESLVASELSLGTALIREGRMAEGLWHYWTAYENTTPTDADASRQSALSLIGAWSHLAGRPLVNDSAVRRVMFSRSEASILVVTDRAAQQWDVRTGEPLADKIAASDVPWQAMAVSHDAETLIVASGGSVQIWDVPTGTRRGEPLAHGDTISEVAVSADGTTILTRSPRLVRLWNARTGARSGTDITIGTSDYVLLAPDGGSVFVGFDPPRLSQAASGTSTKIPFWPHHDRNHRMALFSPDGSFLIAAGSTEEEVRDYEHTEVWRVGSSGLVESTMSHRGRFTALVFSRDSRNLLTGGDDNTAHIWRLSGDGLGRQGPPLPHGGAVVAAAFGEDRKRATRLVLTGGTDKMARLWRLYNLTTTVATSYLLRHGGSVDTVAMSADTRTLVTGSSDGIARLWNPYLRSRDWDAATEKAADRAGADRAPLSSQELEAVRKHEPSASIAAVSLDKAIVAVRGGDSTVRLRRVSTGELVGRPLELRAAALGVAFSPDSRLVSIGSADNTATIWDARTGEPIGTSLTHEDAVNSVEFSPDGRTLLTASGDTKARFWDVTSGALLGDPLLHSYRVQQAHYLAGGRQVITRASGPYFSDDGSWNALPPAADKPECLKLSLEWRTGYRIDAARRIRRLAQAEWLAVRRQLDALEGPCDAIGWDTSPR
jgi:WD40 repeat protein